MLTIMVSLFIVPPTTPKAYAAFPGCNDKIVFMGEHNNMDIWSVNADGTGPVNLTNTPGTGEGNPAVSPDGSKIAFSRWPSNSDIWVMNIDGSGQTQLTDFSSDEDYAAWSPDGSKILFIRDENSTVTYPHLWVMNADGTGQVPLATGNTYDVSPSWSPDGSKILVERWGNGSDIWVINADGSGPKNLTRSSADEFSPDWSPDGSRVVFQRTSRQDHDIFTMKTDGTQQTRLTTLGDYDGWPTWSPDGSRIVFNHEGRLMVMSATGAGKKFLTAGPWDSAPSWGGITCLYRPDAQVKIAAGVSFTGNGVFNTTGMGQTVSTRVRAGRTAVFNLQVHNDGIYPDTLTLKGQGLIKGFGVRYAVGGIDATTAVAQGTFQTPDMDPGEGSELITLTVKVRTSAPSGTRSFPLTATSAGDQSKDVVKAKVVVL